MAIKFNERYPGRSLPATTKYPQGGFKNRSAPDSKDGTYLEQDWANDISGFLQWLMSKAGITANGTPDDAMNSQYAEALSEIFWSKESLKKGTTDKDFAAGDDERFGAIPGINQSIRVLTNERQFGVIYENNTDSQITVYVTGLQTTSSVGLTHAIEGYVENALIGVSSGYGRGSFAYLTFTVPPKMKYRVNIRQSETNEVRVFNWVEQRK